MHIICVDPPRVRRLRSSAAHDAQAPSHARRFAIVTTLCNIMHYITCMILKMLLRARRRPARRDRFPII